MNPHGGGQEYHDDNAVKYPEFNLMHYSPQPETLEYEFHQHFTQKYNPNY